MIFLLLLCYCLFHDVSSELEHGITINDDGENITLLDAELNYQHTIKRRPDYRMDRTSGRDNCIKHAKCIKLNRNICMGTRLPYSYTTLSLIPEVETQDIVEVDKITVYYILCISNILLLFFFLDKTSHEVFMNNLCK